MNGFGMGNNCCLWILIIMLILCACKTGMFNGLFDNCYCLPLIIALVCCVCKNGGTNFFGGFGGPCK